MATTIPQNTARFTPAEVARATGGVLVRDGRPLAGVSTDTRTLAPGSLYVALRGETFDGHRFLPQATAAGAGGVLISTAGDLPPNGAVIRVPDTRAALVESAPGAAALAQKSTEKKTRIQAGKTPEAMDMEASIAASAPVLRPEVAPAPGAAASASLARSAKPAAKAPSRSDETTEPAATAEAMAPQISRSSAQLPLCPLTAEVHGNTQAAKEGADKASGIAGKPLDCRPRKHGETQPDDARSGWDASKYIAYPPQ